MAKVKVYEAINNVRKALAVKGISKNHKNNSLGYSFRGIDDVYAALAALLPEHGLCILPRYISRTESMKPVGKSTLIFSVVEAEFDFVCVEDGSYHTVRTFGEAMDSGDKATNKAMSAAYKYAAFQTFSIPTEGDNDSENQDHKIKTLTTKQRESLFNAICQSVPWIKKDRDAILWTLKLVLGRDSLKSVNELSATDVTYICKNPDELIQYAPSEKETERLAKEKKDGKTVNALLPVLQQILANLSSPGCLPPDLAKEYGSSNPADLNSDQLSDAIKALKGIE